MKEYSKTFCVYPWIQQQTTPGGRVNFCCISYYTSVTDDEGKPFELDKNSFSEAWNVNYMKDIRKKMMNGEAVKGCETCYKQENMGKRSYRQMHNQEWSDKLGSRYLEKLVEKSAKNDFVVDTPPAYLDLRLGNLCNLKCRMCNPHNSVQIYKEWERLDKENDGQYTEFWKERGHSFGGCGPWYESETFWSGVEEYIPHLKKVYMTGGEPTLIEGNYRFLKKCIEMGYASKIELFFNINFTQLKDSFLDQLNDFKWVSINASLDGINTTNEYIRPPSRWNICDQNFRKAASWGLKNFSLGISPVVQIYNILNMVELCEYAEEVMLENKMEILVDFLFCFSPSFLDIAILPDNVKLRALEKLEEFKPRSLSYNGKGHQLFFMKDGIDSMITRLRQTMGQENPKQMLDFVQYTKTLDVQRKQSFSEAFPELNGLLLEAGYDVASSRGLFKNSNSQLIEARP